MKAIHLICHQEGLTRRGLHCIDSKVGLYLSECWVIENAASLCGGWLYFHETSALPADFAGRIQEIQSCVRDDGKIGTAFVVKKTPHAGQRWRGVKPGQKKPHGGIVEADNRDEIQQP